MFGGCEYLIEVPVLLVTVVATVRLGLSELRQSLLNDRKEAIKNLVQIGCHVLEIWNAKEKSGALSREAAQRGAIEELSQLRFANNNYFYIQSYAGVTVLHGDRTLEGKNRINATDSDGVHTVALQIEAAKRGGDFMYYRAGRTGGTTGNAVDLLPKLAYATSWTIRTKWAGWPARSMSSGPT